MLYRNSWMFGGVKLGGKEVFVVVFLSGVLFLTLIDFEAILNKNLYGIMVNNKVIILIYSLFIFSTLFFNIQEIIKSTYYFFRLATFICYFFLYFWLFPQFLLNSRGYLRTFIIFINVLAFITASLALLFLFAGINPPGIYMHFAISYIWHPNISAFMYTVSIFATIYFYQVYIKNLSAALKIFTIMNLFIQFLALYLTFCRAAVIGISVGLAVYVILLNRKKWFYIIPFLSIIVPLIIKSYLKVKSFGTFFSRFLLLIPAYHMLISEPKRFLFGYGTTDTFRVFEKYKLLDGVFNEVNNPHNALLSLCLMYGVMFTLILCIFLIYKLFKGYKFLKTTSDKKLVYLFSFLITSIISIVVHNLFDSQLIQPEFFCMQYFLVYLGLIFFITKYPERYRLENLFKPV